MDSAGSIDLLRHLRQRTGCGQEIYFGHVSIDHPSRATNTCYMHGWKGGECTSTDFLESQARSPEIVSAPVRVVTGL